jgi:PAS domain S-box-containing protein
MSVEQSNPKQGKAGVFPSTDIQDRGQQVLAPEEVFGTFLGDFPMGIYVLKGETVVFANDYVQRVLGYSREELVGTGLLDLIHPEDRLLAQNGILGTPPLECQIPNEYRLTNKAGGVVWVEGTYAPIEHYSGRLTMACFLDITQEKQVEEMSRQSEEWFSKAFRSSPDAITISTLEDGRFIEVNDALLLITGYQREEFIGHAVAELDFWPKPKQRRKMVKMLREHGVVRNFEMEFRSKSGEILSGLVSAEIMPLAGEPCIVSVLKDITERKQAERALKESEEFSSNLLSNSPNPILVINPDTSIRYVNAALENMTGYFFQELVGWKSPYPWWVEEAADGIVSGLGETKLKGARRVEECFKRKNGERFWVETTSVAVKNRGQVKYYLSNWVDVTEQRRRRENLEFYISEVTRAQEEERRRIARELHDETIQALACLYIDVENIISVERELSRTAVKRLQQLRGKIDSALEEVRRFSHELRPGLLDRFGLIPSLELLVREVKKDRTLACSLEVSGLARRLSSEAELALFRIAQEALHNVKKHSCATRAIIKLKLSAGRVQLCIIDNGIGFRLPAHLSNLARGGKLGLIGMNERVRLLNGGLSFESEVGKGTTVVVDVPL